MAWKRKRNHSRRADVVPHQEEIRGGRQVVEALRSGVEINALEQFMNIDSLGVLRRSADDRAERVYCSKLVYLAYSDLDWPTQKSLGRTTFTPDDVAARAARGNDLDLVAFYHDGRRITERPREVMAQLMEVDAGSPPGPGRRGG